MSNLTRKPVVRQFYCSPIKGGKGPSSFRYEEIVSGKRIVRNHSETEEAVGQFNLAGCRVSV